jgi:Flp pilus assembly protein TadG
MTVFSLLNHLRHDRRGLAATEFALVAPILITAWLGAIEACTLARASLKAQSTAYTVADLTAQVGEQTTASLNAIIAAAQNVLAPLPNDLGNLAVTIASVGFNASTGAPEVMWKYTSGGAAPTIDVSVATGLGEAGESVVITRVSYAYQSFAHAVAGSVTFSHSAISRPRTVRQITLNGQVKTP